jgi:hypothetical protein
MKVYRISPQRAQVERSKALKRTAFLTALALTVGFLLGGRSLFQEQDLRVILATALFTAVMLTVSIWWSLRKTGRFLAEAYSSFEITADEQTWTKKQKNTPDVTLAQSEALRVEEWQGKGFRICTADRHKNIWVPCELDGYEQLKSEVLAVPGVAITSKSAAWLRTYLAIAILLALFAASFLAGDKWISAGASLLIAAFFFFSFFKHYRNPNLTSQGKRQFVWAALIGVCLVVRAIFVLRS